jgi:hypothetical protein
VLDDLYEMRRQTCDLLHYWYRHDHHFWISLFVGVFVISLILSYNRPRTMGMPTYAPPFIPGLHDFLGNLPRPVMIILGGIGALCGLVYALETHSPVKLCLFVGGVLGFWSPITLLLIDKILETIAIAAIFLILYWFIC